jgi:predicted DCC family thiol-disulfide oxidoreductase YuxK|tara:strand:- start:707 stop:1096 length:390 start_codon:yes stop_codon:yes gene_type:complete
MKVYYNQSCSICRAEINLYKKQNIDEIEWVDITNNIEAKKDTLKDDRALLRRLHVKDGEKVFSGAKAFLLVWKKIPKYRFLYRVFKLPIVYNLFSFGYEVVAYFLYLKNKKQLNTLSQNKNEQVTKKRH